MLEAADSFRFLDPAMHARDAARAASESLTARDPEASRSASNSCRSSTIARTRSAIATASDDAPALDRALRAAQRAIELAPASSRAYQDLFVWIKLYARHDVAAAFAAGETAMALNKYDLMTVAEFGGRLVMTGEVERGLAMLRRASEPDGGVLPAWQHYYLFLGNYLAGDMQEAASQAEQITDDDYPLGLVARAIAASRGGNGEQARRLIERLMEVQPAWRTDARRLLEKGIYKPESVARLLHELAAAGLAGNS